MRNYNPLHKATKYVGITKSLIGGAGAACFYFEEPKAAAVLAGVYLAGEIFLRKANEKKISDLEKRLKDEKR
ncbi:hypothetical protein HOA91_05415 [Candidatus Woesearchaeota archaeon]|jgi:hypothetical protein|nr:hypothetical protein [Candidatus Woesearchaeota archaeon]